MLQQLATNTESLRDTHELHKRHTIVLYYGNGVTEEKPFFGDAQSAYRYADKAKRVFSAKSAIVKS